MSKSKIFQWTRKHLIGLSDLSRQEIEYILVAYQGVERKWDPEEDQQEKEHGKKYCKDEGQKR